MGQGDRSPRWLRPQWGSISHPLWFQSKLDTQWESARFFLQISQYPRLLQCLYLRGIDPASPIFSFWVLRNNRNGIESEMHFLLPHYINYRMVVSVCFISFDCISSHMCEPHHRRLRRTQRNCTRWSLAVTRRWYHQRPSMPLNKT